MTDLISDHKWRPAHEPHLAGACDYMNCGQPPEAHAHRVKSGYGRGSRSGAWCPETHETPGSSGTLYCRKRTGHENPHVDYHGDTWC